jgi:hypothetical protein
MLALVAIVVAMLSFGIGVCVALYEMSLSLIPIEEDVESVSFMLEEMDARHFIGSGEYMERVRDEGGIP